MATYTIQKGDTLSGIAQQYGTTVSDLSKSNNIANPDLIQSGANLVVPDKTSTLPTPTTTQVNVPETFKAADLGTTPTPIVAPPPTPTPPVDPFVASLDASQKSFEAAYNQANTAVQPVQQERDALTKRLQTALDSIQGKGTALTQEEAKLGVPDNIKQLNELNLQITQKKGEYDKAVQAAEGQAIPLGIVQGQQGELRRQQAVELGALASVAQALQGNISLAQQTAARTVDLEFADKEQEVKNLQTLLDLNKDNLTAAEKKRADELTYILQQRQNEIDKAKEDRKTVLSITSEAAQTGADNVTLSKMAQAKTPQEALQIAGPVFAADYRSKQEGVKLENTYKKAQIANIYSEIQKRNSEGIAISANPAEILAYAQQYSSTGQIPTGIPKNSFGLVSQVAKELPKPEGTLVDVNTGIKPSKLSSTQEDAITALYDLTKKLDDAGQKFNNLNTGVIGGLAKTVFYTKAQQQYDDLKGEIVDLLARARSGAALTENEVRTYENKLPGRFNNSFFLGGKGSTSIEDLKKSIEGKLKTTLQTNGLSLYGYSTVKMNGQDVKVGSIVSNGQQQGRVNPDGTITILQ